MRTREDRKNELETWGIRETKKTEGNKKLRDWKRDWIKGWKKTTTGDDWNLRKKWHILDFFYRKRLNMR